MLRLKDDTPDRRAFLRRCAASAFGVSMLGRLPLAAAAPAGTGEKGFGKAKHVIFLMMSGGMTHIDTFDPKKGDTKGPGKVIRNNAGGEYTHYLTETAKVADKIALIRSMTAKIGTHREAQYFMRTAYKPNNTIKHPMLGAWGQKVLGKSHPIMPSTVSVGRGAGLGNGFLPSSMSPLPILDPEAGLQYRKPLEGDLAKLQERLRKLDTLDGPFRDRHPDRNVKAYGEFYDSALQMMGGEEGEAFDLRREPDSVRDAYGRTKFGQGCLLARRLVEAGVRFVEVQFGGWDMHKNIVPGLEELMPVFDQTYPHLLRDLEQRGLLRDTLVVLTSEFGRTPSINNGGRNHHPPAFTSTLAGAGIKGGYVHGETDATGGKVVRDPVTPGGLHATIGWAMGIRYDQEIFSPSGRPFKVGKGAEPVMEVFA